MKRCPFYGCMCIEIECMAWVPAKMKVDGNPSIVMGYCNLIGEINEN